MNYQCSPCLVSVLAALLLCCVESRAEELEISASKWDWLEGKRKEISRSITDLGQRIDIWLAGENLFNVTNETHLAIRLKHQLQSHANQHTRLKIGGSLHLPQTEERWKFVFDSDSNELGTLEAEVFEDNSVSSSFAGFQFLQRQVDRIQISHGIGIGGGSDLDPYYRMTARYNNQISEKWGFRVRQRFWHYNSEGWGYNTNAAFNRTLSHERVLQISSEIRYQQSRNRIEFGQSFNLHNTLSNHRTFSYETGVIGSNRPNRRVELVYAGVRYRRALRDDWLFLEIIPQAFAERDNNWSSRFRLAVNIDVLFFDF